MDHKAQRSLWKSDDGDSGKPQFNPNRLTIARKWNGLSKIELAERVNISLRSVTAHEAGSCSPDEETLNRLISALDFGREFFFGADIEEPNPIGTSFRSYARLKASRRDMALARGAIGIHISGCIESKFELPKSELPDLSFERTPEAAAESLRRYWAIGVLPIRNMIHLLEAKGVRVFSVSIGTKEVDAFSFWKDSTPFVFLNTNKSAERSRYDAAHELGHLVLHRHGAPKGKEAESEADAFASAFLMPRADVLAHAPRFSTLESLIKLKKIWSTSLASLVYRQHALGILSDWHYRTLYVEMAQRGFLTDEPEPAKRETSQILPKVFAALYEEGVNRSDVARELALSVSQLEELMFGLVMMGISGGRKSTSQMMQHGRPALAIVSQNK